MTTEHQISLEDEGFTAPTDSVTITLSRERYMQLQEALTDAISRCAEFTNRREQQEQYIELVYLITIQQGGSK